MSEMLFVVFLLARYVVAAASSCSSPCLLIDWIRYPWIRLSIKFHVSKQL